MEVWETEAAGWQSDERREKEGKGVGGQGGRKQDRNKYTKVEKAVIE